MLYGNDSGEYFEFGEYPGIFCGILLVPHNTLMDLNDVMDHLRIWVLFGSLVMFSNFYQLDLHKKNSCCINKILKKYPQKWIEIWTSRAFIMAIKSVCLLIS